MQGIDQLAKIMMAAHAPESPGRLGERGADPAQEHPCVAQSAHISRVMRHRAVEVLDRIGGGEGPRKRPLDAQALYRQRLLQPFLERVGRPRMLARKRSGEPLQLPQRRQRCLVDRIGRRRPILAGKVQFLDLHRPYARSAHRQPSAAKGDAALGVPAAHCPPLRVGPSLGASELGALGLHHRGQHLLARMHAQAEERTTRVGQRRRERRRRHGNHVCSRAARHLDRAYEPPPHLTHSGTLPMDLRSGRRISWLDSMND